MNLGNRPPIFVPNEYRSEIEKMSKAAVMDLAWDFATTATGREDDPEAIMQTLRERAAVVQHHRRRAAR